MSNSLEWDLQAKAYELVQIADDSLDSLIEYPAQLSAIGCVKNMRVLDIACGSARKAYNLVKAGAKEVYAFDISDEYDRPWGSDNDKSANLHVFKCDLNKLHSHELLKGKKFDLVLSLQAAGYPKNPLPIFKHIRNLLKDSGRFIYTTAHPMRFAVEKSDVDGIGLAKAYHDSSSYSYCGAWNSKAVTISHPMTISQRINCLLEAGFSIEGIDEPFMSSEHERKYPHKYSWMEKYFGMIIYKLQASNNHRHGNS